MFSQVHTILGDITQPDIQEKIISSTVETFGQLDILVTGYYLFILSCLFVKQKKSKIIVWCAIWKKLFYIINIVLIMYLIICLLYYIYFYKIKWNFPRQLLLQKVWHDGEYWTKTTCDFHIYNLQSFLI